jgi:hypothetical protein
MFVSFDGWRSVIGGENTEAFRIGPGRVGEEGDELPWGDVTSRGDRNPDAGCAAGKDDVSMNGCVCVV